MASNDNDMVEYEMNMVGSHTDMVERFSNTRKPKNENKDFIKKVTRSRRDQRQRQRRHDSD